MLLAGRSSQVSSGGFDKRAMDACFDAASVVVIGASSDPFRTAGKPLYYLSKYGYSGQVSAVNPKHSELFGFPCYGSVEEIPYVPELALVMLPAVAAVDAVAECAQRGVRLAIVYGSGFSDAGDHGLQGRLREAARSGGMRLLGPNCLGSVNCANMLTATFSSYLLREMFRPGHVSLVTQSGSIGNAILVNFQHLGVGLSKWVATGNEADLDALDFIEYLIEDDDTHVVVAYTEAVPRSWRWLPIAQRARDVQKPIVVLKSGNGPRSHRAVISHSGRMAGSHRVWHSIANQLGLIVVETIEELCDDALGLSILPGITDEGLAVLGTGGTGLLVTDECERLGVPVAELSESTQRALRDLLPASASVENPVDPGPISVELWTQACVVALQDSAVGSFLTIINSLVRDYSKTVPYLRQVVEAARLNGKVLAISYLAAHDPLPETIENELRSEHVLVLQDPVRVARVLAAARKFAGFNQDRYETTTGRVEERLGRGLLDLGTALLNANVPVVTATEVRSLPEVIALRRRLGRIALKVEDRAHLHKTDVGLVRLNIVTDDDAIAAFNDLQRLASMKGARVSCQQQIDSGVEVIIGCHVDIEFGPIVSIGSGGVLAELIDDVAWTFAPVDQARAHSVLEGTRVYRLLTGHRGQPAADIQALCMLIEAVSNFFTEAGELVELELNPVIVQAVGRGAWAVDVLGVSATEMSEVKPHDD